MAMTATVMTAGVALIGKAGDVVSRLASAYENCKRLDFEMAKLRTQHDLAAKAIQLKKEEIAAAERAFNRVCTMFEDQLKIEWSKNELKHKADFDRLSKMSNRLLDDVLRDDIDETRRDKMISLLESFEKKIELEMVRANEGLMALPGQISAFVESAYAKSLGADGARLSGTPQKFQVEG